MANDHGNRGALATVDRAVILERIAAGEYVPAIADELGVSRPALTQAMWRWDKDQYTKARETAAELRLEQAMRSIEGAEDVVTLARARETFRAVAWRAEREFPARWGAQTKVTHEVGPDLGELLRQAKSRVSSLPQSTDNASNAPRIIDVTPEQTSDSSV